MNSDYGQIASAQEDDGSRADELVERYREGVGLLHESVEGLDHAQLLARPIEGKLSTQEVVCHVADCEQFYADRMKRTIGMNRPLLLGVDGWLYFEALHYAKRDIRLELELVRVTREQMAFDLARLEPEAWSRMAVHSETGLVTLRQLLQHAIRHLEWHVGTIRDKRAAMGVD